MEKLINKNYLITGASGYLGSSISEEIAKQGGNLILVSQNKKKLFNLKNKLKSSFGVSIICLSCNLLEINKVKKLVKKIKLTQKYLNGIVNCAYKGKTGQIKNIDEKDFSKANNLNITSPFILIKNLENLLVKGARKFNQLSSIVNVSSIYGVVSPESKNYFNNKDINPIHYGTTKSGMIQMSRYLACNFNTKHIRVNTITPGAIPHIFRKRNKLIRVKSRIPLGRFGSPSEIAKPIVFLLSEESSYITGANLIVDGGWTSW